MNLRRKQSVVTVGTLAFIYAVTPFIAGLAGSWDRRGPRIFAEAHHEILYRVSYALAGRGKPRVPYMQRRSWFYGIPGERIPEHQPEARQEATPPQR